MESYRIPPCSSHETAQHTILLSWLLQTIQTSLRDQQPNNAKSFVPRMPPTRNFGIDPQVAHRLFMHDDAPIPYVPCPPQELDRHHARFALIHVPSMHHVLPIPYWGILAGRISIVWYHQNFTPGVSKSSPSLSPITIATPFSYPWQTPRPRQQEHEIIQHVFQPGLSNPFFSASSCFCSAASTWATVPRFWIWVRRVVLIWRLVHYFVLIHPMMSLRMMSFRWMTMRHCRCLAMKSYCYFFATRCRHPAAALLAFGCVPVKAKPGNSHHFRTALLRQGTD